MGDKKYSELDSFWAIEKLVPKKTPMRYTTPKKDTSAAEISFGGSQNTYQSSKLSFGNLPTERKDVPRKESESADSTLFEAEYSPESPLLRKVKLYRWRNNYNYYEDFCESAKKYLCATAKECSRVPFFSYVPQYVQLTDAQLSFYLYWRECVRQGNYIDADYSYIILLIFEIINLGELYDCKLGQSILCKLHKHYRRLYPRLDRYLGDWICDYSLIHRLPPPDDEYSEALAESSTLKEFYLFFKGEDSSDEYARLLIKYCSSYDYRRSKFAVGDNLKLYAHHVPRALSYAVTRLSDGDRILSGANLETNNLTRDAYTGALCSSKCKRRLEIDFYSFSRSHEMRFLIGDIIKYSENKIRAYLGIKSRLGVYELPKNIASVLDEYFAANLKMVRHAPTESEKRVEEYDKLYDAPRTELSLSSAESIESASWETTNLLISAFDSEESTAQTEPESIPEPAEVKTEKNETDAELSPFECFTSGLDDISRKFLLAALDGDGEAQKKLAKEKATLTDAIADEINELAAELLGDVILDSTGDFYTIIEDYRELFEND